MPILLKMMLRMRKSIKGVLKFTCALINFVACKTILSLVLLLLLACGLTAFNFTNVY